ncbi:MAG: carbohydrate-binding domain-containing protein [Clostridia bacterium]|nr:carbohydrate-binding domain-containing protein [Clostridia bacterium]
MKKRIALLLMLLLLTGCTAPHDASADPAVTASTALIDTKEMDFTFTDRELAGTWEVQKAITITGNGSSFKASGKGIKFSDGQALITSDGVYHITGTFTDLPIVVRADDDDKVQLVLDNVEITCADGPAILIESADKVFITLPEGTRSTLADGPAYALTESGSPDGAIFSRADLCLNGSGALSIVGQYKHGIVSKDDLIVAGCTLEITAASTGLDGKDCVMITGADVSIDAGSNGMRSDNKEDESRGFIYLTECALTVVAGSDGIQAATVILAQNIRLNLTAGGGSSQSMRNADGSWKGLKAGGDMLLDGGEYTISSKDDCIHSNSSIVITSGTFALSSGDDGVHADTNLTVAGGDIVISKSYEGMEASKLTISGGRIDITASDDGLNAAGGADGSAMGNRFGRGMFSNGVGEIIISGGHTVITSKGDGIDSNNSIAISGGVTLVSGPYSSMNAAFDYDGSATVTGGILIATGAAGMAQSFTEATNQGAILVSFRNRLDCSLALLDEDGRVVVSFTPANIYQSAVFTAPAIQLGRSYTIQLNGVAEGADADGFALDTTISGGSSAGTITMTDMLYGGSGGMFGHPGGGGGWRGW